MMMGSNLGYLLRSTLLYFFLLAEQMHKMTLLKIVLGDTVFEINHVIQHRSEATRLNACRPPQAFRISNVLASKGQFAIDSGLKEISNSIRPIVFETHHLSLFQLKIKEKTPRKVETFKLANIETTFLQFLRIFHDLGKSFPIAKPLVQRGCL